MKKVILMMLAITSIVASSKAQTTTTSDDLSKKIVIGFKAGTNYSNVYDEQVATFHADAKFGLAVGGFVNIPLGKYFGIQPEVLFSQKGFKAKGSLLGSPYTFTRTTSFIDIPILVAIKPSEFFTLLVGPQYSYLINRKDVFENTLTSSSQEQAFNNDNIRKNILSAVVGGDFNYKNAVLSVRAAWDFQQNNGDGTSTTPRYKNRWLQATIGFRF
jgi:hypothetical protein